MSNTRFRRTRQLLHPATLIAVLALVIATSGTAYAIVITGKQIKDGTVGSVDIKNGSLGGVDVKNSSIGAADLAPAAKGARAVASVWSDGTNCFILSATSRGFTACSRGGVGDYTLTVSSSVSLVGTYPICSRGSNGGFNSLFQFSCNVGPSAARQVRLRLTQVDETTTGSPQPHDAAQTIPAVVVIP
ncbi:MAG: hypothetical protein NTV23_09830 [Propionibacteriales bacterium]|nr:hypothetical protein [Propionibacteriales bacterium]